MSTSTPRPDAVPLPRLTVGYLQSEGEMLRVPDQDLASFFARGGAWKADLFTARRIRALLEVAPAYDCVVLGYNAFYDSAAIRAALADSPPQTGLLVLHQLVDEELPFLTDEFALGLEARRDGGGRIVPSRRLGVGDTLATESEVLLNWPREITLPEQGGEPWARFERTLALTGGSGWRSVLEVERDGARHPVVVRTPATRTPGTVVSTLILDYDREDHRDLLTNMLVYCAVGLPETAVVGIGEDSERGLLARKLRLQGAAAVETSELRFDVWPTLGAREVVLPRGLSAEDAARAPGALEWLAAGGLLMTLDEEGTPSLTSGASDAAWVAQRWATWFAGVDPAAWQGRIGLSHVVLHVLERLHSLGPEARAGALELPEPSSFAEPVRALLARRFGRNPHAEQTISATAAGYELHGLVGGAFGGRQAKAIESWLRERFDSAYDVDRLTIARSVRDPDLVARAVRSLEGKQLSPLLVTHLCEAALATGFELPRLAEATGADADELERSLDGALVLSARFLAAVSAYAAENPGKPLPGARPETVDRAISTLREFGVLACLGDVTAVGDADVDQIGHETLALLAYFGLSATQTAPLRSTRTGISSAVAEYLVRESERLRSDLAAESETAARLGRQAAVLRQLLGVAAVALGAGAFFLFDLRLDFALSLGFALLVFAGAAGGLLAVGWAPGWLEPFLTVFRGGISGAGSALAGLLTSGERKRDPGR